MNQHHAQQGVFAEPFHAAHYLEYKVILSPDATLSALKSALKKALNHGNSCYTNIAFGSDFWDKINSAWRPEELVAFETLAGNNGHTMPSNQSDILFWIHDVNQGEIMNTLLHIHQTLDGYAEIVSDISGFKNPESRDLTGFVDGTENPKDQARFDAALIAEGKAGAGGSYVFTQQWQHHLKQFNQLPVSEQEKIIGRTKVDDIELEGDDNPPTSHVSRTDAKIDGVAAKIFRRSTPYGNASDHGLYFIALSCELKRINIQLERMLGNTDDGCSDHLMKYSTAKTGAYWFMPSRNDLERLLN